MHPTDWPPATLLHFFVVSFTLSSISFRPFTAQKAPWRLQNPYRAVVLVLRSYFQSTETISLVEADPTLTIPPHNGKRPSVDTGPPGFDVYILAHLLSS